jgi:glutathione S-transferase
MKHAGKRAKAVQNASACDRGIRQDRLMAPMKLYMTPGSCSTGIHIILEELEEIFEAYVVNLPAGDHFKPDYVAINPKSTIPTLVRKDGTALTEVQAIAYWLGRSHPRAKLWPVDAEDETRMIEAMAYIVGTVHCQGFARIFATATFARDAADHESVRMLGRDIVEKGFAILSDALGSKLYLAGNFSVADSVLFYVEFWADKTDILLPANLAAHYRRMLARPAVQRVLREEGYNLATLGKSPERESVKEPASSSARDPGSDPASVEATGE